jgi:hypothetical protein
LVGGDTESGNLVNEDTKVDMMAGKTVQTIDMVWWRTGVMSEIRYAEYEFKNLRWYNNWTPFIIGVNYSGMVAGHINGKGYSGYEPLDPIKGKNKLYFIDGNDPAIILELDGPFLP